MQHLVQCNLFRQTKKSSRALSCSSSLALRPAVPSRIWLLAVVDWRFTFRGCYAPMQNGLRNYLNLDSAMILRKTCGWLAVGFFILLSLQAWWPNMLICCFSCRRRWSVGFSNFVSRYPASGPLLCPTALQTRWQTMDHTLRPKRSNIQVGLKLFGTSASLS